MEQMPFINNDFNAYSVAGHLSGKQNIIVLPGVSIGSGYGLLRVAPSGYYPNYPDIVDPNLVVSRIIGLNISQRSILITPRSST
jgi:hypothetical protein